MVLKLKIYNEVIHEMGQIGVIRSFQGVCLSWNDYAWDLRQYNLLARNQLIAQLITHNVLDIFFVCASLIYKYKQNGLKLSY